MQEKRTVWAVALVLACAAGDGLRADDKAGELTKRKYGPATKPAKPETREAPKAETGETSRAKDGSFGNKFTSFWIHDVGGTIGNGLKKGSDKIQKTFN